MIARARRDFWPICVRTRNPPRASRSRADSRLARMNHHGRNAEFVANRRGGRAKSRLVFARGPESERGRDLLRFLEIEAQRDASEFLELRNGRECVLQILDRAFLGVGEVEEENPFACR